MKGEKSGSVKTEKESYKTISASWSVVGDMNIEQLSSQGENETEPEDLHVKIHPISRSIRKRVEKKNIEQTFFSSSTQRIHLFLESLPLNK